MEYKQTLFPFMSDVMLQCYLNGERDHMREVYNATYKRTGMNFTTFVINVYIPHHAEVWELTQRDKYFKGLEDIVSKGK